jgi:U4/U6.U5 tri-snRNP-associated protein 1
VQVVDSQQVDFVDISERSTAFPNNGWLTRQGLESRVSKYGAKTLSAIQKERQEAVRKSQEAGKRSAIGFTTGRKDRPSDYAAASRGYDRDRHEPRKNEEREKDRERESTGHNRQDRELERDRGGDRDGRERDTTSRIRKQKERERDRERDKDRVRDDADRYARQDRARDAARGMGFGGQSGWNKR